MKATATKTEILSVLKIVCLSARRTKMKINEWLKIIKSCKKSNNMTGGNWTSIKVNPERTIFYIFKKIEQKTCRCCGSDLTLKYKNPLTIEFSEKPNEGTGLFGSLSVFESNLLFMVFREGILPYDYAKYHECEARKRFIQNIREVRNG